MMLFDVKENETQTKRNGEKTSTQDRDNNEICVQRALKKMETGFLRR